MSIGVCAKCRQYIDDAALKAKRNSDVVARLILAVKNNADDAEITALKKAARICFVERKQASERYRQRVNEQTTTKAMVAASGPRE
jgi:hypothetical protein